MNNEVEFLLYNLPDEEVKVQVIIKDETIWSTQKAMAQLFDYSPDNISLHLKNIFNERELLMETTAEEISVVQQEGTFLHHKLSQKAKTVRNEPLKLCSTPVQYTINV
jgi:hypothetical protein